MKLGFVNADNLAGYGNTVYFKLVENNTKVQIPEFESRVQTFVRNLGDQLNIL